MSNGISALVLKRGIADPVYVLRKRSRAHLGNDPNDISPEIDIPLGHINPPVDHHPRDDQGASMGYNISHRYTENGNKISLSVYHAMMLNLETSKPRRSHESIIARLRFRI